MLVIYTCIRCSIMFTPNSFIKLLIITLVGYAIYCVPLNYDDLFEFGRSFIFYKNEVKQP